MTIPRTNVVGVFQDAAQADHALVGLRHAGFSEDRLAADAGGDSEEVADATTSGFLAPGCIVVTVQADDRHAEVANLLLHHGAQDTQWVAR